jgi:hypothetical protein
LVPLFRLKRRPLQKNVWVPLRALEDFRREKVFGEVGYVRDTFACGSLAVPLEARELGEKLTWSDIGVGHDTRSYADEQGYKPVDEYWLNWSDRQPSGMDLVLTQGFGPDHPRIWHLHQDIVIALGLLREGDVWVRPEEGYLDVARLLRGPDGDPHKIEIRTEHLRDYLAARRMALRVAWYRDRDTVLRCVDHITWRDDPPSVSEPHYRFETRLHDLHEDTGLPFGGQSAVFTARRTDVDPEEDVPEFGPETDDNVEAESRAYSHSGARVFRVEGEIWCEEWVEPSEVSSRVRGDDRPSAASYIVDASGSRESADVLDNEDVGKYLWFRPDVINDLLARRGAKLHWYTRDTGMVEVTYGYRTHFGINSIGLINAYAYDVAKLPEWQRLIWQGYNVPPEGRVSRELLAAQMEVNPAGTHAPESHIRAAIRDVDELFSSAFGVKLFRGHGSKDAILKSLHRFRALQIGGIYELAKDVTRVVTEDLDVSALHTIAPPGPSEGKGSLKSLERVIGTKLTSMEDAKHLMSILHGVYELRGIASHLPGSETTAEAFRLTGVRADAHPLEKGRQLLHALMYFLAELARLLYRHQASAERPTGGAGAD